MTRLRRSVLLLGGLWLALPLLAGLTIVVSQSLSETNVGWVFFYDSPLYWTVLELLALWLVPGMSLTLLGLWRGKMPRR